MEHHPVSLHSALLSIVAGGSEYELDCRRNVAAYSQIHASLIPPKPSKGSIQEPSTGRILTRALNASERTMGWPFLATFYHFQALKPEHAHQQQGSNVSISLALHCPAAPCISALSMGTLRARRCPTA